MTAIPLGTDEEPGVVLYEVIDGIALVRINRPAQMNALSRGVREGLREAWRRFDEDPAARVAILTGTGERAFCAGMDLKEASGTQLRIPPYGFIPTLGGGGVASLRYDPQGKGHAQMLLDFMLEVPKRLIEDEDPIS